MLGLNLFAVLVLAQQASSLPELPKTSAALPVVILHLKEADALRVLKIQREQYRHYAQREEHLKQALQAQADLDRQNAAMTVLQEELKRAYQCPDCTLQEDLTLRGPVPVVVEEKTEKKGGGKR